MDLWAIWVPQEFLCMSPTSADSPGTHMILPDIQCFSCEVW